MDEPVPMPAFTFNPDGPTTITHPDGTVSVNAPRPDGTCETPSGDSVTAAPGTGMPDSDAGAPPDPPGMNESSAWGAAPDDAAAGNSVVNPDGSITTRLPDGSTQTVVRLPGGATIVTSTTPPGACSPSSPPDSQRPRRRRGRSR
jgi:hypothetical protein